MGPKPGASKYSWHPVGLFFSGQTPVLGRVCPYGHDFSGDLRKPPT